MDQCGKTGAKSDRSCACVCRQFFRGSCVIFLEIRSSHAHPNRVTSRDVTGIAGASSAQPLYDPFLIVLLITIWTTIIVSTHTISHDRSLETTSSTGTAATFGLGPFAWHTSRISSRSHLDTIAISKQLDSRAASFASFQSLLASLLATCILNPRLNPER